MTTIPAEKPTTEGELLCYGAPMTELHNGISTRVIVVDHELSDTLTCTFVRTKLPNQSDTENSTSDSTV